MNTKSIAALLSCLASLSLVTTTHAQAKGRAYSASKVALELNGQVVGTLPNYEGGAAVGDVVTTAQGTKKHIGSIRYEPITIECGINNMSPAFYDWLKSFRNPTKGIANGAIVLADFDYKVQQRLEFNGARITEIAFPELDASSKESFKIRVTFQPQQIRTTKGDGSTLPSSATKNQAALASNFRLSIDGIDCNRVNRIAPFTLSQTVATNSIGESRNPEKVSVNESISPLLFSLSEAGATSLQTWQKSFLIDGKNTDADEKEGKIEILGPDLKAVLFTLNLHHLGIYRLGEFNSGTNEQVRRLEASLYCESVDF
jgi:hypothetical protein